MSLEVVGKLTKFLEVQGGTTKEGKEWKKQQFIVETEEQYNNLYCFEVFGEDKVENLTKYQKEGDTVKVTFNVNTNEWNGKYFTSLSSWRIEKLDVNNIQVQAEEVTPVGTFETVGDSLNENEPDDLPF